MSKIIMVMWFCSKEYSTENNKFFGLKENYVSEYYDTKNKKKIVPHTDKPPLSPQSIR